MKYRTLVQAAAAVAVLGAAVPAAAGYVVLDGWQLQTPTTNTTGIGRLNLASGSSLFEQEVDGLGQTFVGAKFAGSGSIYAMTHTRENVVGAGDSGPPSMLGDLLNLSFSNVAGKVVALNPGGGFKFQYTSGSFLASGIGGAYASGLLVGLGGNASSAAVIGGFNGDATFLGMVLNTLSPAFVMKDSLGNNLASDMAAGKVLFQAVLNMNTTSVLGTAACSFDATRTCTKLSVASGGDGYLVADAAPVPEPSTYALMAAGLAALGLVSHRRRPRA